jgi:hypothetical protein
MLTIMVFLRSNQKLPTFPRGADRSPDHVRGAALCSCKYIKTRAEYSVNAFQISEVIPATAATGQPLPGEQMFSVAALDVSSP